MADLTTAVGELLKKKNTEENLHIYVEGLSSLYKRMAELRLAMNYYTFAEIYSDFDFAKKTAVDPYINEIQQIINDVILLDTLSLDAVERIDALRNRIIAKMEILTAYTDIFQIYEYVLNRVEYRFSESEFGDEYYNDRFEKDIYRYITGDKDNTVINMKLSQIVGQVPMRLSKNKFYDMLKDSFSIYKGSEKQSVNDFAYMIRTAGTLYKPQDFEGEFPELKKCHNNLKGIEISEITEEQYKNFKKELDRASALIEEYSDFYVMLTEVINDVYSVELNFFALTDAIETDKLKSIISDAYYIIEGHDIEREPVSSKFVEFEGLQEKIMTRLFNPESALDEIIDINSDCIKGTDYEEALRRLVITSKLQSASTFASLNDNTDKDEADDAFIEDTVNGLVEEFASLFEGMDRYSRRAVMAIVIANLPVFFNNMDEFKKYVHVALSQCTDSAERQACMTIINSMFING